MKHQAEYLNNFFAKVRKDTFQKSCQTLANFGEMPEAVHINLYHNNYLDAIF